MQGNLDHPDDAWLKIDTVMVIHRHIFSVVLPPVFNANASGTSSMTSQAVEKFKSLYRDSSELSEQSLAEVYSQDVVFVDPLHHIEGLDALGKYLQTMYGNVLSCRFEYLDEIVKENQASIKWVMRFRHRKLAGGKEIEVRGVTLVEFTDRITRHEDFFDAGSMLYEHIPVMGAGIRYLKRRIS